MPLAAERKGREGGFLANFKRVDGEERQESDALCKSAGRLNSPNMFLYSLVSFLRLFSARTKIKMFRAIEVKNG